MGLLSSGCVTNQYRENCNDDLCVMQNIKTDAEKSITYRTDRELYGIEHHVAMPKEINGRLYGDCEDIALWSYDKALRAGISPYSLKITTCLTKKGKLLGKDIDHAVLLYNNTHVLDNAEKGVVPLWEYNKCEIKNWYMTF